MKQFMTNIYEWCGKFEINIKNAKTKKIIEKFKFNNLLTNGALNELCNPLQGTTGNLEIKYLGLGNDDTTPVASNFTLNNEIFRTAIADQNKTGTGEITSDFVVLSAECNQQIEEIGIFAGTSATGVADTGVLVAHVLWSYLKTSSVEIDIRRIDTIQRPTVV
jgi:hypothetical protein